ncbi:MAG TPA: HEAT repeat domain-containing protein, partial [Gemmatimonadaceae bacterium]|nr:HEAT repeat domain-containing protein [Gemmatimonadaceae bacterium]
QTISHSMLRLLSKLAVHAERGAAERRVDADAALRENVRMLVGQWTLEDPNPDAYRSVLEGMSKARPRLDTTAAAAFPVEEQRLVQMSLEIGVAGDSTWRAIETMVEKRQLPTLIGMLERGPRPAVAQRIWERVATPERVRALISEPQPDWHSRDRLVGRVGLGAANALADALEDSEDQRRQGQIINLLAKLGDDVGAVIARRLPQSTAAVQAQLLLLLGRLNTLPAEFDPAAWVRDRTPAVRREAIKLLWRRPETREQGIMFGVLDVDERTVLAALNEAASNCPRAALPVLMNRVDRDDIPPSLRALAIRTVASIRSPDVVDWVLRFVMVGRKRFFGGERLAPKSPELLAALTALGSYWPRDPRVVATLARAAKSSDAEIRHAAISVLRPLPNARRLVPRPVEEEG